MNGRETMKRREDSGYPKIGIYAGLGTSHSWLWFMEIFDRMGLHDVRFLTEAHLKKDGLNSMDVVAVSGGDTFAIARGLGPRGAKTLRGFIENGGLYIGSCAGAYLPLHSSKEDLSLFNFVPARIANLARILPKAQRLKEKFCTAYGCAFIFHPVREAVQVATNGFKPFSKTRSFHAPLYGGPPMIAKEPAQILATYSGFTDQTVFLVDEQLAAETVLGKAAVIRQKMGKGYLHLYGPHFEHPRFTVANQCLKDAMLWDLSNNRTRSRDRWLNQTPISGQMCRDLLRNIKREISHSRITAVSLETLPVRWTIGNKVYETAKIREFIEPVWKRILRLERQNQMVIKPGQYDQLMRHAMETTAVLRQAKRGIKDGLDTVQLAKRMFAELNRVATLFLEIYFRTQRSLHRRRHP